MRGLRNQRLLLFRAIFKGFASPGSSILGLWPGIEVLVFYFFIFFFNWERGGAAAAPMVIG